MVMRGLSMTILALALAGCVSVGPNYTAPVNAPVSLQDVQAPVFSTESPVANWWSQFDDPVLEELVRLALADNLDLQASLAKVREARAVFSEARLDQAPHVTADGSYDRRMQPDAGQGGERVLSESYQLGFDAGWELDLFGRKRRAAEAARADLGAERDSLADVQVTVAAEVARNYFELRGTQKRIAVATQTLVNLRDTQRLTEVRQQLGGGSELDVQNNRAQMKSIEANIPLLQVDEAQSRRRLAVLAGKRPDALDDLLHPSTVATFAKALPLGDTSALLRRRPDVREAERRLAAATARVGVATADLFPRISLSGFFGFLSGDASGLISGSNKAWSVTPSISWAAFDFGTVRARLRASQAQADGVAATYAQTVLLALEDTGNAVTRYAKVQQRLALVVEQATAARRAEALAQISYREGSADFLTLLDAQRNQLAADDALAAAEADVNVSVVAVYKALGGAEQDAPPVAVR